MKYRSAVPIFAMTLLASACGVEGVNDEMTQSPAPQAGQANPVTDVAPVTDNSSLGTNNPDTANAPTTGNTATEAELTTQTESTTGGSAAQINSPVISFQGTSVQPDHMSGDIILLDGSYSDVVNSELISYQWTQVDDGKPLVTLIDANTATASFIATPEVDKHRLTFELNVEASNGTSASARFSYVWNVEPLPGEVVIVEPTPTTPTEPVATDSGSYVLGKTGSYYAESASSIYVADQSLNQIVHLDMSAEVELGSFPLTDQPTKIVYLESSNSLYVALKTAGTLVKISLDDGAQTEITIASPAIDLDPYDGRIYYTVEAPSYQYNLYSVGLDGVPQAHGLLDGDLLEHNPANGELVAVEANMSPSTVYRYSYDASGTAIEMESNRDLGSTAADLSISPDGQKLAVAAGSGNGYGYTIHDVMPANILASNGAWDTGPYPTSADFSTSGALFVASNTDDVKVFDALTHVLKTTHVPNEQLCGLNYYNVEDASFTMNDQHIIAKLECGSDAEKTVLFFYPVQ